MNPLRVGIVGMGFGARVHRPAFSMLEGVEVAGVAARNPDWRSFLHDSTVAAVSVATPPATHAEIVCEALNAGKHVLCEKPFGRSVEQATSMRDLATQRGLIGAVGFQFRMEQSFLALRSAIAKANIGKLQRIDVTWLVSGRSGGWQGDVDAGGGVIEALASHVVDYLEWLTGKRIEAVTATAKAAHVCELALDLFSGIQARVQLSSAQSEGSEHRIEMSGSEGMIFYRHCAPFDEPANISLRLADGFATKIEFPVKSSEGKDSRIAAFSELAGRFVKSIRAGKSMDVPTFDDGLRVRRVLEGVHKSVSENRRIAIS